MSAPPGKTGIAGTPSNAEAKAAFGQLWDYVVGRLGGDAAAPAPTDAEKAAARAALAVANKIEPISAAVTTGALTLTLNPTALEFRSNALTSGAVNSRSVSSALTLVVPLGATLGSTSAVLSKLMLLAIDNAGTVELAVCNGSLSLDESTLISTTVLNAASDSASVIYSATALTNVPFRIVGYVESTQATAGTWATAPSKVQGIGGQIRQASITSGGGITQGTAVASTSGTAIDFTGIPSWAKRITVMFSGVSTTGVSALLLQLGSGTVTTTGYNGSASNAGNVATAYTAGIPVTNGSAAAGLYSGVYTLANVTGNTWVASGNVGGAGGVQSTGNGSVTLSGPLDRIRSTAANGTDIFDGGLINIFWES